MNGNLSNVQQILNNGQKSDLFTAQYEQLSNHTASHTYLHVCIKLKVLKHTNTIGKMKTFTKPNCSLCME